MSDRLVRTLCGAALAVILSAWTGSVAGMVSWHLSAPSLPDRAWGQEFAAGLLPSAVLWATGTAAPAGAVLGFVLGASLTRRARPRSRAKTFLVLGVALSLPVAVVAAATMVAQLFAADGLYPFIPWDAYMYAILRPLAIAGFAAFGIAAVLFMTETAKARTSPADPVATV